MDQEIDQVCSRTVPQSQVIDVKNVFLRFLTFFLLFSDRFLFLKNVGKVQSGKQINKEHFQNTSNEIDL